MIIQLKTANKYWWTELKKKMVKEAVILSPEKINELLLDRQGNKELLLKSGYLYIVSLANKYCKKPAFYDDYLQAFLISFNTAIDLYINNYDETKKITLINFANMYFLTEKNKLEAEISIRKRTYNHDVKKVMQIISDFTDKFNIYPSLDEVQLIFNAENQLN